MGMVLIDVHWRGNLAILVITFAMSSISFQRNGFPEREQPSHYSLRIYTFLKEYEASALRF